MKDDVLKYCPNYNKITNFKFFNSDYISEKLVSFYKAYINELNITNIDDFNNAKKVDGIVAKYIDDYSFRKEMKRQLLEIKVKRNVENVLKVIIENIIKIFDRYEEGITRNVYIARWL